MNKVLNQIINSMNKLKKTTVALLFSVVFMSVFTACKKETDDNTNTNNTKTLNKSLLVGKKWYNQGGTITHDIRANGVYGSGGTWSWKNNSDTMIFDLDGSGTVNAPVEWKFYWSAEHEMACKRASSSSGEILYKDQSW